MKNLTKSDMNNLKNELKYVQEKVIRTIQAISRVSMSESVSASVLDKRLGDITDCLEEACVEARRTVEKYRPSLPFEGGAKEQSAVSKIAGEIEVTAEGWVHITLNTLLPNCRYKTNRYMHDTLMRLLESCPDTLPKFEHAFLAIVEYCDYESRTVFDQDNKAWKAIPNALKGRVFEDDDQFRLDIGLFTKMSENMSCQIYVIPEEQLNDFMYYLSNDLL